MRVNLAPNHKQGLQLSNPVMIGGGSIGYGEAVFPHIDTASVGAVVVGPLMCYSSGGSTSPRVAESQSSFVLQTGFQNRGVSSALKLFGSTWPKLNCPVITQVADTKVDMLLEVLEKLNRAFESGIPINGIELLLPTNADERQTETLVTSVIRNTDLPLLVNLPLPAAEFLADPAVYGGADALVVGYPPSGTLFRTISDGPPSGHQGRASSRQVVSGSLGGTGLFPLMLDALIQVGKQDLGCPLIGVGGIHLVEQAKQVLDAGAVALQLDSALWVEPGIVQQMVDGI